MEKKFLVKSKNSKIFDLMVEDMFFSKELLNIEKLNSSHFYSNIENNLKTHLKIIKDQRCLGYIKIIVSGGEKGITFLKKHREQGNLKARLIKCYNINDELIIINTAGGVTSGDLNFISIDITKNTIINITTQSMEKVYKCKNLFAHTYINIIIGSNAYVSWMPLETIFFNQGKLRRRINVDIAPSSNFFGIETIVFGRKAMGEIINQGELNDAWQVNKNGKLIYSDFNRLKGNINNKIFNPLIMKGNNVFCNIIYTGKKINTYSKRVLKYLNKSNYFAGSSIVNGILLIKILAKDVAEIRSFLDNLIIIFGDKFNLPKIWSC